MTEPLTYEELVSFVSSKFGVSADEAKTMIRQEIRKAIPLIAEQLARDFADRWEALGIGSPSDLSASFDRDKWLAFHRGNETKVEE